MENDLFSRICHYSVNGILETSSIVFCNTVNLISPDNHEFSDHVSNFCGNGRELKIYSTKKTFSPNVQIIAKISDSKVI